MIRAVIFDMYETLITHYRCPLYIGDGGSQELEAARSLGMNALQATWYFQEGTFRPCGPKEDFQQLVTPMDVMKLIK